MSGTAATTRDHDHDDDAHGTDAMHFSVRGYLTGFLLSLVLTAIPFWLVMAKAIPGSTATAVVILAFAVAQIFVHMVYFLHLDTKSEGGWNLLSLIFALVLVVIVLSGSMWVMHHLDANMMPATMHEMRNMP
jgi:cytochrome o ubiquinol oxidase operon protein cyoD